MNVQPATPDAFPAGFPNKIPTGALFRSIDPNVLWYRGSLMSIGEPMLLRRNMR
jgi:hypothetical protein